MTSANPLTLLIGLDLPERVFRKMGYDTWLPVSESIDELEELATTAGLQVVEKVIQKREAPDSAFYIGIGKCDEIKDIVKEKKIQVVITDDELSPKQHKQIEQHLDVKVLDRTGLILDIFAQRARTHEAQLQVELAQLEYLLPRLTRLWTHLSRQSGGIGMRGPGETQLEVDRRRARERMSLLKSKIEKVKSHRTVQRSRRESLPLIVGAILGYTNAGKSTLINAMTEADVLAEDKLFATLDPTTKRLDIKGYDILLTDTVGFIQKLPHALVTSFRSTLEEVIEADFHLHVVDVSNPHFKSLIETSEAILKSLNADHIPQIYVFNKMDRVGQTDMLEGLVSSYTPHVLISAKERHNFEGLYEAIERVVEHLFQEKTFHIPYNRMDVVNLLHKHGTVLEEVYEDQIMVKVRINKIIGEKILGQLISQ